MIIPSTNGPQLLHDLIGTPATKINDPIDAVPINTGVGLGFFPADEFISPDFEIQRIPRFNPKGGTNVLAAAVGQVASQSTACR